MYILLRHCEKKSGSNPSLTELGNNRAATLARMFGENPDLSIFSTAYNRTRETAAPLSQATGQPIIEYDRHNISDFAATLAATDGPKCVIGHSRSTLELLEKLTGIIGQPINEDTEFDRLYMLRLPLTSATELLQMRYGPA